MFVCMDANFRLKNQLVSNYSQDPGLGIGWAYMLPREPYESYVLQCTNSQDVRHPCLFSFHSFSTSSLDQHLCWLPSTGSGEYKVHKGFTIYGCRWSILWAIGDGFAYSSGKSSEGRTVRYSVGELGLSC